MRLSDEQVREAMLLNETGMGLHPAKVFNLCADLLEARKRIAELEGRWNLNKPAGNSGEILANPPSLILKGESHEQE